MPGTGNYTGTNVNSTYIFDVSVALDQLRDNSTELIDPKDIRDSVWTLWNRLDDVQITASQSLVNSGSSYFTNVNPTTLTVGGITAGTTFNGTYSLQQMFDLLLYPYTAPILTISASNTPRQFGSGLATTLSWQVVKKANVISSINVNGTTVVPPGDTQTGTTPATATHSLAFNGLLQDTLTFTMSVGDGTTPKTATTTVVWRHKIYWGKIDLSTVPVYPNPNLTTTPGAKASVTAFITGAMIKALSGAGIGTGNALATSYAKTYDGINAAGQYLIFAHPTIFGPSPTFKVNGLPSTTFTKVWDNVSMITEFGLSVSYDVWISNTAQNSPVTLFEIK